MALFWEDVGSKPKVTETEWQKKVRTGLSQKGFTRKELDQVEGYFAGDMREGRSMDKGLDKHEIGDRVKWFRDNKHVHTLNDEQIDTLEKELHEHL